MAATVTRYKNLCFRLNLILCFRLNEWVTDEVPTPHPLDPHKAVDIQQSRGQEALGVSLWATKTWGQGALLSRNVYMLGELLSRKVSGMGRRHNVGACMPTDLDLHCSIMQ